MWMVMVITHTLCTPEKRKVTGKLFQTRVHNVGVVTLRVFAISLNKQERKTLVIWNAIAFIRFNQIAQQNITLQLIAADQEVYCDRNQYHQSQCPLCHTIRFHIIHQAKRQHLYKEGKIERKKCLYWIWCLVLICNASAESQHVSLSFSIIYDFSAL